MNGHSIGRRTVLQSMSLLAALPQMSAQEKEREAWNRLYTSAPDEVTAYPNRFLAEAVRNLKPGPALDIGMGQGRNSLYLARLGWKVTGVDISDKAVEIAKGRAVKEDLTADFVVSDFSKFDLGESRWDLIVGVYMGGMVTRPSARIAASLREGGHLVAEHFHIDLNERGLTGDPLGYPVNALLEAYVSKLRIVRYEEVRDFPDWSNHGQQVPLVRMLARKGKLA